MPKLWGIRSGTPQGFKNDTHGDLTPAINAIKAANGKQTFLGVDPQGRAAAVTTKGNPSCHLILRGGNSGPNFEERDVQNAIRLMESSQLPPSVMVESNLVAGAQSFPRPLEELTYGQSITDECIDWETTLQVVRKAYQQIGPV